VRRDVPSPAWEKKSRAGPSPAREKKSSAKGAPWPGRSTAACSPVGEHARRRGGRRRRHGHSTVRSLDVSLLVAPVLALRSEEESGDRETESEEREGQGANGARVAGSRAALGF